ILPLELFPEFDNKTGLHTPGKSLPRASQHAEFGPFDIDFNKVYLETALIRIVVECPARHGHRLTRIIVRTAEGTLSDVIGTGQIQFGFAACFTESAAVQMYICQFVGSDVVLQQLECVWLWLKTVNAAGWSDDVRSDKRVLPHMCSDIDKYHTWLK